MLESLEAPRERDEYAMEEIGEKIEDEWFVETDKAWDAMHRCLGEFPPDTPYMWPEKEAGSWALPENHGSYPLKIAVLGGKALDENRSDFFLRLIESEQLPDLVEAIDKIDEDDMRERYFKHCKGAWPEYGEEDFGYTWAYFEEVRDFFREMKDKGRAILFSVSL